MCCPYCNAKVVIEKRGMRKADKALPPTPTSSQVPGAQAATEFGPGRYNILYCSLSLFALLSVLAAVAMPSILFPNEHGFSSDKAALRSAAASFQRAWLHDDVETAKSHVIDRDWKLYESWSKPRRAALTISFGNDFQVRNTAVEIVHFRARTAIVRIKFVIRGREQQAFQDWHQVDGQWRLNLSPQAESGK